MWILARVDTGRPTKDSADQAGEAEAEVSANPVSNLDWRRD